jgi:hypothetical protein
MGPIVLPTSGSVYVAGVRFAKSCRMPQKTGQQGARRVAILADVVQNSYHLIPQYL